MLPNYSNLRLFLKKEMMKYNQKEVSYKTQVKVDIKEMYLMIIPVKAALW
jgi:hypothetical protein